MSNANAMSQPDATSVPTLTVDDLAQLAERVDHAVAEAGSLEPAVRAKALALKSAIEEFHKVGLTKIVRRLKEDPRGKELLFDLVDDSTVYALFSMHGLVRADLRTRVSRVIEMVRPTMQSHGGDVTLVDVRDNRAFVQLSGNCNGCSMSSVTLRTTVEESLKEHVPEIEGVEVVPTEPDGGADGDQVNVLQIQLPVVTAGADGSQRVVQGAGWVREAGWVEGPRADDVSPDRPMAFEFEDTQVIVIRSKEGLRAFRNACAHQGLPLERGVCDVESGTITCPWHGFQFDSASGECFSAPQCQLEPFPLRVTDGVVWVRPT
jgi:nitrite reductase/ring-hydroxylating ferredoxin subunit/Fe-S cluster biogenesis protein NfuA